MRGPRADRADRADHADHADRADRAGRVAAGRLVFWAAVVVAAPLVAWTAATALGLRVDVRSPAVALGALTAWAVAEEIVFRGHLQPALGRWIATRRPALRGAFGITPANAVASAVFAAAHLLRHPPLLAALVWPVSLLFGAAREQSGRTFAPVLLHVYCNACLWGASLLVAPAA